VVDSYPVDESVYGVRGLCGNVQDWCADVFKREGPVLHGDTIVSSQRLDVNDLTARARRGGVWNGTARSARSADRRRNEPGLRDEDLGFRVAFRPGPGPQHR